MDSNEIFQLIRQGEGERLEWKDSRILKDPFKLARSMTAIANQSGGLILIGVKDDGTIEGIKSKKGHEEHIMNIASDRCNPPIRLTFQRVEISRESYVYALTIPRRKLGMYHGVRTTEGLVYFIRVGPTIREMLPHELTRPRDKGVQVEPYTSYEKGLLWLGKKLVEIISTRLDSSPTRAMLILIAIGLLSMAGALLLLFRFENGQLVVLTANYPWWANTIILVWLVFGAYLSIAIPSAAVETRCPACKSFFAFTKISSKVLKKRTISEHREEWTVRNLRRCNICNYEEEKTEFEEYRRD